MKKLESLKGEKFSKIENLNSVVGGTINGEHPTGFSIKTRIGSSYNWDFTATEAPPSGK